MILGFKNVARKNMFFKNTKNRKCLYIKHLRLLRYQIYTKILVFHCSLGGGEAGDGHAEWRTASVVHANLGAELN